MVNWFLMFGSSSALWSAEELGNSEPTLEVTNDEPATVQSTNAGISGIEFSNAVDRVVEQTQRSFLILQEQLRSSMQMLEQARQESEVASRLHAAAISNRISLLEQTLTAQRANDLTLVENANRHLLLVIASFAGVLVLLVLVIVWFQVRSLNRLTEVVTLYREPLPYSAPPAAALAMGSDPPPTVRTEPDSSQRLLGAVERLEQRIQELEHTATPELTPTTPQSDGAKVIEVPLPVVREPVPSEEFPAETASNSTEEEDDRVNWLLGKGQSFLNAGQVEKAMACFDEVIVHEPHHAEALMKKGVVLERQERYKEALDYYDRAIEANRSLTLAYLHKGGVFNQLERFDEALQCYEQALRLQQLTGNNRSE